MEWRMVAAWSSQMVDAWFLLRRWRRSIVIHTSAKRMMMITLDHHRRTAHAHCAISILRASRAPDISSPCAELS
eukprot:scaffold16719_cov52-Attheya_sp.AAC.6